MPPEDPKRRTRRQQQDYRQKHGREVAFGNAVKVDLVDGITAFKQQVPIADLVRAATTGHYDRLQTLIPWHDLEPDLAPAGDKMLAAAHDAAKAAAREVKYPDAHRFDLKNPKFKNFIEQRTGNLITVVQDGMLDAVRSSVSKAFTHGWSPQDVANNIRGSIGLNARQAQALASYRAGLSTPQKGFTPDYISKMSTQYESRLLDQRATMIGRTEVRKAQNAGQQEVWESAVQDGLISHDTQREWVVDGDPCPELCKPMSGVKVGLYEPWVLPDGRRVYSPDESHPNCFCVVSLEV